MKLLTVTGLKEHLGDIANIFKLANIDVFSTTGITGHRTEDPQNLLEDWFISGGEQADSMMVFTFTKDDKAYAVIEMIVKYNAETKTDFPIRAFVMPVETSA